jgi:heptosyltransferase-2
MSPPQKILIVQPNWVGDAVMATPTLRAIRELYPQAHISYLMRRYVKDLYSGMPWVDQLITYRTGKTTAKAGKGMFDLAARLRTGKFDLAVLLPNSFKSALVCKMANIPRIFGYERDGRGFLLTDRLLPVKEKGKFVPSPILHTYLGLARYLGSNHRDVKLQLFLTDSDRRDAQSVLTRAGLEPHLERPAASGRPPLILLNPSAQYGAAKLWKSEYFAELGDRFIDELGATVLLSASPRERAVVDSVQRQMKHAAVDLSNRGMTLGSLKEVVRRCDLMITNDTGPRHIAAAMDVPVVTIFGPTHPEWTEIYYPRERQVAVKVFCGPCQKKVCPLDHRCMTRVTPAMVWDASMQLLSPERMNETPVGRQVPINMGAVS